MKTFSATLFSLLALSTQALPVTDAVGSQSSPVVRRTFGGRQPSVVIAHAVPHSAGAIVASDRGVLGGFVGTGHGFVGTEYSDRHHVSVQPDYHGHDVVEPDYHGSGHGAGIRKGRSNLKVRVKQGRHGTNIKARTKSKFVEVSH
ncbi:hypothetical protein DSO57_1011746 [Entomophthora muscae]|uniref:Uncharacterized protein n=1 Tax=Entomophthora muscae TaxID=34485 RepID=A0ACC2U5A1_9FUNG|nr:hypothetical protein DSO57_1011746 [Entomophthora muscae]